MSKMYAAGLARVATAQVERAGGWRSASKQCRSAVSCSRSATCSTPAIRFSAGGVYARYQSSTPAAAEAPASPGGSGAEEAQKKKQTIGSKVLDYFVDHPWHFFGPLIALAIGFGVRSYLGGQNEDALSEAMENTSPCHAREVTTLGRTNGVTIAQWRKVVDAAIESVQKQILDARAAAGGRALRPAEIDAALSLLPSQLEAVLVQVTGKPVQQAHILARAASGFALARDELLRHPVTNDDVEEMSKVAGAEADVAASERLQLTNSDPSYYSVGDNQASDGLHRPWDVLPASVPIPSRQYADPRIDVLYLLSLYGAVIGGRPEVTKPPQSQPAAGDAAEAAVPQQQAQWTDPETEGFASPSQRLSVYVSMIRQYKELRALAAGTADAGSAAVPVAMSAGAGRDGSASSSASASASSTTAPRISTDIASYSFPELAEAVQLLGATHQIPTRLRIGPVTKWPVWRYGVKTPYQSIHEAVNHSETKAYLKNAPPGGAGTGLVADDQLDSIKHYRRATSGDVFDVSASMAASKGTASRRLTRDEAKKIVLQSRAVCLWGECFGRD